MPFTISHAVLAPIIHKVSQKKLPISAIAIGCMVPDLVRLFTNDHRDLTHKWTALIYPNLMIGLAFCLIWYFILRPTFFRFCGISNPTYVTNIRSFSVFSCLVILSVLIGISTHIIWDGLTHLDHRTFVFKDFLGQSVTILGESYPVHLTLQIGTSILALPIIGWMAMNYYQSYQSNESIPRSVKIYAISLIFLSLSAGIYGYIYFAAPFNFEPWNDLYAYTGTAINYFFRGFLLILLIGCLFFQILEQIDAFEK